MRWCSGWVLAAAAHAGCGRIAFDERDDAGGTPIEEPPRFSAGARLQPVVYTGTPPVLAGWYDRELGIECTVRDASDGAMRCQPTYQNLFAYKDAGCTQAVAAFTGPYELACGLTPRIAFDAVSGTAYELGAQYSGPMYTGTPTVCQASIVPGVVFERGAVIPDSQFVRFTPAILSGTQRLAYLQLVGDDGSQQRELGWLFDTHLATRCSIEGTEPDQARCVPPTDVVPGTIYYRDAACTQPIVSLPFVAPYVAIREELVCRYSTRFWERGAPYTGPVYRFGAACAPTTAPDLYELGPELASDAFASLSLTHESFDARLESLAWRTADAIVTPVTSDSFYDTQRGHRCRPLVEETTSQLVCAPSWNGIGVNHWIDATCSDTSLVGRPTCRTESAAIYFATAMTPVAACEGNRYQISMYDAPSPRTVWERRMDGTCESRVETFYTTTRTSDGSELQSLTRVRL